MIRSLLLFILLSASMLSCSVSEKERVELLPNATGKSGDMIIMMDSLQWNTELGKEVKKIFMEEVEGLPRPENMFNVTWIHPKKNLKLLRQIRTLVYIFTLDDNSSGTRILREGFTPETLERIERDTSFYFVNTQNEFSRGQEVVYLFGDTKENLIKHLQRDGDKIQDFFNKIEKERTRTAIYKTKSTLGITTLLSEKYGFELRLPVGYRIADQRPDFAWVRLIQPEIDNSVFVSWKPYESEYQLLPDSLIAWRNEIAQKYLFEDPDNTESYVTTETTIPFIPVKARQININNNFVMQLKGLWKTNNKTMGGPFVSHAFVDQQKGVLYYVEGFTFSPARKQRETIRELEAILETFKSTTPKN